MSKELKMHTENLVAKNIEKLTALFPNCMTEIRDKHGNLKQGIDFDLLRQELSEVIVEGNQEHYRLDWVGKKQAILNANEPTAKTLRPCREESVNFDTTKNLFIEGDNLDALKLLQSSYLGKVKMIYIDPPYNTGNDFIYNDNFTENTADFLTKSNQIDEESNRLISNPESNGRFHSKWLSMMYSRLKLARNLLTDDGVIFISIDDNEVHNLRKICDELFGIKNFIAQIIVDATPKNDPYIVSTAHEYCLVYTKNFLIAKEANYGIKNPIYQELLSIFDNYKNQGFDYVVEKLKEFYRKNNLMTDNIANYKYCDELGIFRIGPIDDPQSSGSKDNRINPKTGNFCKIPTRGWSCSVETWETWRKENLILFPDTDDLLPQKKTYITNDRLDVLRAYFKIQTRKDTTNLKNMFDSKFTIFSNPKPLDLIKSFLSICQDNEYTVLDFFAGSGTTAHSVYELNKNGKNIRYITVQISEKISVEKSKSNKEKKIAKAAIDFCSSLNIPSTISEISKERIRRAGRKILEEQTAENKDSQLDIGFRVLKIDSSNMENVYYTPDQISQGDLFKAAENIKADRSAEDLLFQVMIDFGLDLALPIEAKKIGKSTVYYVAGDSLAACFENLSTEVVDDIIKIKPLAFVSCDGAIISDQDKTNIKNRFTQLSPHTDVKFL